jgi:dTDP-4-dehydrorhamnose reductase
MKLLTGSSGMIGRNLKELMPPMLCPTHGELDLTDRRKVKDYLSHNKPEVIIHTASNDDEICLYDNLRMFINLAESKIPMITFSTGREIEDRPGKVGEYILSKHICQELALNKYKHIVVIKLWGCFGKYEKSSRFFMENMLRVKAGMPILVREDKMFSFVYIQDLVSLITHAEIRRGVLKVVAYTDSLSSYAKILKKITGSPHEIMVLNRDFHKSYTGKNTLSKDYTPIEQALMEMWHAVNLDPGA